MSFPKYSVEIFLGKTFVDESAYLSDVCKNLLCLDQNLFK